jgi:hypothetical protein
VIEPHADRPRPITLGTDKRHGAGELVKELSEEAATPHVTQNIRGRRSGIEGSSTRHPRPCCLEPIHKRAEEACGYRLPRGHGSAAR